MSGNVFIICLTVIICAVILAFCHYQEHHADISDDRYQFLCGQIESLKKDVKGIDCNWMNMLEELHETENDTASGFEERDQKIDTLHGQFIDLQARFDNLATSRLGPLQ